MDTTPYSPQVLPGIVSPNNPDNLPSHLSQRTFRVYETALKQAVDAFPGETAFPRECFRMENGSLLSVNTIVARFRDATVSLKRFRWQTTVDCDKLWRISGEFTIGADPSGTSVWFRNKQRKGRPAHFVGEARERGAICAPVLSPAWESYTIDEVTALCLLLPYQRITGPFVLRGMLDPILVSHIEGTQNVAITHDPDRNETVIL